MRRAGVVLSAMAATSLAAPPALADPQPRFPSHRLAVGLGGPQISLGLFGRLYLVDSFFAQVSAATGEARGERQTGGVVAAGARVHETDRTALLVRGGVACRFFTDVDPDDDKIPEPDGCLHFLAGFAAEIHVWWRIATSLGATLGWSPEAPRWLLFPELELTVLI
jgi:hypothetical protein